MEEATRSAMLSMGRAERKFDSLYREAYKHFGISECTLWIFYNLLVLDGPVTQTSYLKT